MRLPGTGLLAVRNSAHQAIDWVCAPAHAVGIVRAAHGVEVELLEHLNVLHHARLRHRLAPPLIVLVPAQPASHEIVHMSQIRVSLGQACTFVSHYKLSKLSLKVAVMTDEARCTGVCCGPAGVPDKNGLVEQPNLHARSKQSHAQRTPVCNRLLRTCRRP